MTPEHRHQLYGGDVSDYISPKQQTPNIAGVYDNTQFDDLSNIYERTVKGKQSIDTTGIVNFNPASMLPSYERDPNFKKAEALLTATLNDIAAQLGLTGDPAPTTVVNTSTIRQHTDADINAANNNVLQAMQELKDLGAI